MTELEIRLIKCLEFFIENDDTHDIPSNGFWINKLEDARKLLCEVKKEPYERMEWIFDTLTDEEKVAAGN